jgi:hypothetical protein
LLIAIKSDDRPSRVRCSLYIGVLAIAASAASCSVARASMPRFVSDGELLDQSELIAIGRLEGKSVRKIAHPSGSSSEYHATLVIKSFFRGDLKDRQITLLIQHTVDVRTKEEKVRLEDNVTGWPRRAIDDARQDQIWFLRKIQSGDGRPDAPWMWGITHIQDVQHIDLTGYFKILLSPEPEPKVRDYLKSHPQLAARAVEYLESREVQRILKEPDLATKYQKLIPYYLGAAHHSTSSTAGRALSDRGRESGPYLMAAFHNPLHRRQRPQIIQLWAGTGYTDCADLLVRLLDENHRTYLDLHGRLERDGLKSGVDPQDIERLVSEVRAAVYALIAIGDPRAEQLLAETCRRWAEIPSAQPEMLEMCLSATESIRQRKLKAR